MHSGSSAFRSTFQERCGLPTTGDPYPEAAGDMCRRGGRPTGGMPSIVFLYPFFFLPIHPSNVLNTM
ncbi:hypothetical protein MMALV_12920 [Candidatus Methanomethylophilus alvi Mx1201]|uniref:Uncharacterized protein n=1 Tax=Methanomethylophilus alvi (strain Mx1201) TaxID=1236689 RepID=M9SIU0_METAX|nr:hypothetical protein MMALV_12920 [Candidatus Methanomethylophilus alvi Mx1201]